ncbi:MAG: hypothetical protein HKO53_14160 [Gemmatimonadetes bacterium]|nr:hypothetical protein [Gemmatimonadota bacterium]
MRLFAQRGTQLTLAAVLATAAGMPFETAGQETHLTFGDEIRITGATVLRGGPASPPVLHPVELEGNIIGMRGDTLLFETGTEPVYWIPLAAGPPLVERRGQVTDTGRFLLVTGGVAALAGATFGWGLYEDCILSQAIEDLDIVSRCPDNGTAGGAALQGAAIGAGVGLAAGFLFGRFAKRLGWIPVPVRDLRYVDIPGGAGVSATLHVGGRP